MKRAHLVNFLAIKNKEDLSLRASLTMKENFHSHAIDFEKFQPRFPIQAYKLLKAYDFKIKIVGRDENRNYLFVRELESDSYGCFNVKIKNIPNLKELHAIELYETSKSPGLEILIGNYIPFEIGEDKKVIICDFDKTLVDTKYSTAEEVYRSLTSPIEKFPTIDKSVKILKDFIEDKFHPFILSASPHFYEDAMRDWLYANNIYSAGIFLKDYRKVFSILEGDLTPKDIKVQGIYKLNHLLDIIYMTGIPKEIVLMGDNFESDPLIYLTFYELLCGRTEARDSWNKLRALEAFKLGHKQDSLLLNKIYQLKDLVNRTEYRAKVQIFIRKKAQENKLEIPPDFEKNSDKVTLY